MNENKLAKAKLEDVQNLIEIIRSLNNLQEDYIDFKECEASTDAKDNAVYTLYNLNRRKQEHIVVSHTIEEKLLEAETLLQELVSFMSVKEDTL